MSKWIATGAVIFLMLVISGAYYQGWNYRKLVEETANAKATAEQLDEEREIRNAVEKLDNTGLRDTILGVPTRKDD